jgi:drug/metabolite transporter (DMT)-like permease
MLEAVEEIRWEPITVLILLYRGPLATAFANWASQSVTRSLGPLASGNGFLAVPVVGLINGAVFLHETLGPIDLAGFVLVLAGIAVTTLVTSPGPAREPVPTSSAR